MKPDSLLAILFTDIEDGAALWERERARMPQALAAHDALSRDAVVAHHGTVVKLTGNGMYATFADPVDALGAVVTLQRALADPAATGGVALSVRCALHAGVVEGRDDDFFGRPVNRVARLLGTAHGGQVLLTQAVVLLVRERMPEGVGLRDLGSVRLRDLASPEHVHQLTHPQLRETFPALRSLETTPNNLPQQVTSFVGRERELAEVGNLLGRSRLVTLVGAGGLGKTRLALQAAADAMDAYPDGIWQVELAPLADPRQLADAVASALGVKEEAGRRLDEMLVRHVASRKLLLILDNCEHLVHACAELAMRLLQSGPSVSLLASSREPLRVAGEIAYPLAALALPDSDPRAAPTPDDLAQCEAVRLFVERATAAQPSFHLNPQNTEPVAEICRRLDGIPLAIELAAARVRALSVDTIAARLGDRFRLLSSGDRTALPRQQTLRASIDWSFDLLGPPERTLLARLAVFAGGASLEAAEAVCAGGEIDSGDVLDLLTHLVDKSLVLLDSDGGRYRMLETVRQYAHEKLVASGEEALLRARHVDYYVAYAEAVAPELVGHGQSLSLARLEREQENLLSAHAHCADADDGATKGLRVVHAMTHYWHARGLMELGFRVTTEALARPGAAASGLIHEQVLGDAAYLASALGRYAESAHYAQEKFDRALALGNQRGASVALFWLGAGAMAIGDRSAARGHFERAVETSRELRNPRYLAGALSGLADVRRWEGELDAAEALYEEALAHFRTLRTQPSIAIVLFNLAMVSIARGALDRARRMLVEASTIAAGTGSRQHEELLLEIAAQLAAAQHDWVRAARLDGAAAEALARMGTHRSPVDEQIRAQWMARTREALGDADYAAAQEAGRALGGDDALAEARDWLGPVNRP